MSRPVTVPGIVKTRQNRGASPAPIFGTWDFKWPHGYTIRIAFQALRGDESQLLEIYKARFKRVVGTWFVDSNKPKPAINIAYIAETLPAPRHAQQALSELDRVHREHLPEYDVLVSFAPLPQTVPHTERAGDSKDVAAPSSELGSYAKRVDYGIPTLFLGPVDSQRWRKDLESDAWFDATIAHEFGHALGLAHTHQNPLYRAIAPHETTPQVARLAKLKELCAIARAFDAKDFEEELGSVWPHVASVNAGRSIPFSDWIMPRPNDLELESYSVMAHFGWSFLIGAATVSAPQTRPTEFDLDQLRAVYPPL